MKEIISTVLKRTLNWRIPLHAEKQNDFPLECHTSLSNQSAEENRLKIFFICKDSKFTYEVCFFRKILEVFFLAKQIFNNNFVKTEGQGS